MWIDIIRNIEDQMISGQPLEYLNTNINIHFALYILKLFRYF